MIKVDGKEVDLTNPESLSALGITLLPGGFIEQTENGVTTRVENTKTEKSDFFKEQQHD